MPAREPDARWMRLALTLGARAQGRVWPNPAVGCVIVRQGVLVGRGWTQDGGRPHAEAMALAQAGPAARGSTAYVTLEPCAHTGKTPPCAEALIAAGIARVVSAVQDPDPRVAGKGHKKLADARISLTRDVLQSEAQAAHAGFFSRIGKGRPMVTLKLAASVDGRIATSSGQSRWITGPQARAYVHLLRAHHDAVMVGRGTSVADDPELTVRLPGLADTNPVRVILDSKLATPLTSKLARTAGDVPVWMMVSQASTAKTESWRQKNAKVVCCETSDTGSLDLQDVLQKLGSLGLTRVFCEGGGKVAASLLALGLVDRLITFCAGVAIGGDGRAALAPMALEQLADAPRFERVCVRGIGDDIMTVWRPV
jgi:diaminohydroxyphosphoribosylaminopyrimidine deaminase / 5-amino-6-(5-phosphoribosylamino)uracil reductase